MKIYDTDNRRLNVGTFWRNLSSVLRRWIDRERELVSLRNAVGMMSEARRADAAEWHDMLSASPPPTTEQAPGVPPYPEGDVVGHCVCGSWPGGKCLRCKVVSPPTEQSEQARQPLTDGWRPIESAPRDVVHEFGQHRYGRRILVWDGCGEPIRARWWFCDGGAQNFIADGGLAVFPTHWMPLPAPPIEPAKDAG